MYEPIPLDVIPSRVPGNPVLTRGAAGSWNASDITATHIFRDPPNNRWIMTCTGFQTATGPGKWGFATSPDLVTWTFAPQVPIIPPLAGDGFWVGNGSVLWVPTQSKYFMTIENANESFMLFSSPDLLTWTRLNGGNPVLVPGPSTFDVGLIFDHETRFAADGTTFEMVYMGQPVAAGQPTATRSICRATSTDNGLTWTKQGVLFDNTAVPGLPTGANNFDFTAPTLFRDSDGVHVFFQAVAGSGQSGGYKLGHAISRDLVHWGVTWPVLSPIPGGFETVSVSNPSCLIVGSKLYMSYCGATLPGGATGLNDQPGMLTVDMTTTLGAGN